MNCFRHRDRIAVGVCVACGKALCGEDCAHDGPLGLHCDAACARRLQQRGRSGDGAVSPVWPVLLVVLGVALLVYGYRVSEWTISVPNLLGMLFVWYGVVLLLQRMARPAAPDAADP